MRTRVTVLTTAAMAVSMLQLFVLGALGPILVTDPGVSRVELGVLVAVGFGVATALCLPAGSLVDRWGPQRALVGLFALSAVALGVLALAPSTLWIAVGLAVGGLGQALANPATNKIILATITPADRGAVTGWKQSGVQLGAFVAGVPLAALAAVVDWRWAVGLLAVGCLVGAVVTAVTIPRPTPGPSTPTPGGVGIRVAAVAVYCLAIGFGMASVNTYLPLYGVDRVGLSGAVAASSIAVAGITGIAGRVLWSRAAGRGHDPASVLPLLGIGAAASVGLVVAATSVPWLFWPGAVGLGTFAVAGNAVAMVVVMRAVPQRVAGRAAAVASAGFFGGFAIGPPLVGLLIRADGYPMAWTLTGAAFVAAALVGAVVRRTPVTV